MSMITLCLALFVSAAEPTPAEVWRAEAERLRRLLGEMVNEAEARPDVNRAWLTFIERELEKTP